MNDFTLAFKRWMREAATIMAKFRVSITPILSNVEENSDSCSIEVEPAPSIPFSLPTTNVPTPAVTTIRVRPEWAAVAAHPHFQREFCEFISECLFFSSRSCASSLCVQLENWAVH